MDLDSFLVSLYVLVDDWWKNLEAGPVSPDELHNALTLASGDEL